MSENREGKDMQMAGDMREGSDSLRVCMVGDLPLPIGGVATSCYNLSAELHRLGVEVTFLDTNRSAHKTIPEGIYDYEMLKQLSVLKGILWIARSILSSSSRPLVSRLFGECFKYGKNLGIGGVFSVSLIALFLFDKLSKKRVDIIHSHHAYPRSLSALIVGNALDIPAVVTIYASEFTSEKIKKLRPVATHICNAADHLISISKHTRDTATRNGVVNNIDVIYLGVDTSSFRGNYDVSELKTKLNLSEEKVVLYVGWLIERKGPQLLLEAVSRLKESNLKVFFIGPDHGLKERLENDAKKLNLSHVYVLGPVDDMTLKTFYSLADIFVFPTMTDDEGFGLVAAEAMASETAVIGSRIGAIPEVVQDNETGLLFNAGDAEDLNNKISILLHNEKLLSEMKTRGREYVKQTFSWALSAERTLAIYRDVIRKHNTKGGRQDVKILEC
jgi:glycosyltransferase involved in cell wall biosynthesis